MIIFILFFILFINALVFYCIFGFLTVWMSDEIFKSANMGCMDIRLKLLTFVAWPAMIKDTLSGFKDTMALEIGKVSAANKMNQAGDAMGGLGSLFGSAMAGMAGNAMGGSPDAAQSDNTVVDSN